MTDDRPVPMGVILGLLAALWLLVVTPWRWTGIASWAGGEAIGHLWRAFQATHPDRAWAMVPVGDPRPLVDPVHLPAFALGFLGGPDFAWNLVAGLDTAVAFAGGAALGAVVGGRSGALAGGAFLGGHAFLAGQQVFGLTESGTLGWFALGVAGAWIRDTRGLFAVTLGALGWAASGPYAAVFGAIAAPFVLTGTDADRRARVVAAGLPGLLLAVSLALQALGTGAFDERIGATGARLAWDPGWRVMPSGGTDLLPLLIGPGAAVDSGRSVYLGLIGLGVAAIGFASDRRGVRAAAWGAAALLLVALGASLRVAGHRIVPLPWALVELVPGLGLLHHTWRAVGPAVVLLVPAVAAGAAALGARRAPLVAAAVVFDALVVGGTPWPRPTFDARPPLAALPGDGALLIVPFERAGGFVPVPRGRDAAWGLFLRRPVSGGSEEVAPIAHQNRLAAAADVACGGPDGGPFGDPDALDPVVLTGAIRGLKAAGFDTVVAIGPSAGCEARLSAWLGAPAVTDPGRRAAAWTLP